MGLRLVGLISVVSALSCSTSAFISSATREQTTFTFSVLTTATTPPPTPTTPTPTITGSTETDKGFQGEDVAVIVLAASLVQFLILAALYFRIKSVGSQRSREEWKEPQENWEEPQENWEEPQENDVEQPASTNIPIQIVTSRDSTDPSPVPASVSTTLRDTYTASAISPDSVVFEDGAFQDISTQDATVGLRVKRGRKWNHGDQDGGPGNTGVLNLPLSADWWMVMWDNGENHAYKLTELSVA